VRQVVTLDQVEEMQKAVGEVYVDPAVRTYAATLAYASRPGKVKGLEDLAPAIAYGASPRASINLVAAGRALAFMRGRSYVLPHDLSEVAPEVIRHRLVLTYEGIASGVNAETIVKRVLERFPPPRLDLGDRVASSRGRGPPRRTPGAAPLAPARAPPTGPPSQPRSAGDLGC